MIEQYVSNQEYQTYYQKLNGLRQRIARDLPVKPNFRILDLATGSGFFAIEVAKCYNSVQITGIDISKSSIQNARKNLKKESFQNKIEIQKMDATHMSFNRRDFDMVINFTGLEDIHMTRGKAGVQRTFFEVNMVLKPESFFCFVVMPPEEMETQAQKIEVALFSYICDATWLSAKEYEHILDQAKFRLTNKKSYYTGKKLTPEQAKAEIRFACKNDPKIYGIDTPSIEQVWAKFGQEIVENGLGHYSKVLLMVAKKVGEVE